MKAVIFDLDGVIVCTDDLQFHAWKCLTDREEIYFTREINNRLRGISRAASLEVILERAAKHYTEQQKEEMLAYKNAVFVKELENLSSTDILPHITELLKKLKECGIKIAIGSSSKNAQMTLKQIGLSTAFDAVVDGTEIKHSKPNPEVFLAAANKLGVKPEDCIVIEDAAAGIEAAKAGHMTAVGVSDARHSPLADYRVDDVLEIAEIACR
ncbi:MAG: beta-phosphoglucomutase [Oscillospiraceae bacterium]|jgi:beta-phosphoglucomutase|nr:beta-phosphoglucomutase [Oscillospiraceae bacterium]